MFLCFSNNNSIRLRFKKKLCVKIILWHKSCFKNKAIFVTDLKAGIMKKVSLIVVLAFIAALALSSCNREACPAYSSNDTETTEQAG